MLVKVLHTFGKLFAKPAMFVLFLVVTLSFFLPTICECSELFEKESYSQIDNKNKQAEEESTEGQEVTDGEDGFCGLLFMLGQPVVSKIEIAHLSVPKIALEISVPPPKVLAV